MWIVAHALPEFRRQFPVPHGRGVAGFAPARMEPLQIWPKSLSARRLWFPLIELAKQGLGFIMEDDSK